MKRSVRKKNFSILQCSSASSVAQGLVGCRKRKREVEKDPPSLPKDAIVTILLQLPAKVLHDQMRFTCREWYSIISDRDFVRTHLEMSSTASIVVQIGTQSDAALCIEKSGSVESSLTETRIPLPGRILGSCHGVLLLCDWINKQLFHLVNPITKARLSLPLLRPLVVWSTSCSALAYASCGHFKAVHVPGSFYSGKAFKILILTIGVDKLWRKIDLESIPLNKSTKRVFLWSPWSVSGFLYWWAYSYPFGFALDVNAEKMYTFSVPEKFSSFGKLMSSFMISLETGLGFVADTNNDVWEIYELTDVKSSEWTKVVDINFQFLERELKGIFHAHNYLWTKPLLCTRNGDFLGCAYLKQAFAFFCYNPKSGHVLSGPICWENDYISTYPHVNTLVSPKNH